MINNLGIYGGSGLPSTQIPAAGPARISAVLLPRAASSSAQANFGGAGNDTINIGGTQGPPGPAGPPGTIGLATVTEVATTPYTVLSTDYVLAVDIAGPSSIVLPVAVTGTVFVVKDVSGLAATNPVTVTATGGVLIDGAATALINSNYGSITLVFNGAQWSIV